MKHPTDSELVREVVKGNTAAFACLVRRHQDMALQLAYKLVQNREEAEEIIQDAFLKAFRSIAGFKGEAKFTTWLYRIVYNTAISRTRKKKLPVQSFSTGAAADANLIADTRNQLQLLTDTDQKNILETSLKSLAPEDQVLVSFFYQQEYAIEEISGITGLTKANIRVKLLRARRKLYLVLHKYLRHEVTEIL
jgi:RNA polymerase sigma-70 factor (ECF subfamily)